MRQEGEPSVEEILESIKKVIARDNRESASTERKRRETAGMRDDDAGGYAGDHGDADDADGGVLELGDAGEMIEEADAAPAADSLLSDVAEQSMRDSLAELTALAESGSGQRACAGGTSVEGMVREMLKPMLAQWLDKHMPGIVERLVKAEIARLNR
jgi:cell pole-organizing protein PopZ